MRMTSPREKLPVTLLMPFGNRELPRSRMAAVAPSSTVISPAGGCRKSSVYGFQAESLGMEQRTDGNAFHHITNNARLAARGNNGVDTRTASHVSGLQFGTHAASSEA